MEIPEPGNEVIPKLWFFVVSIFIASLGSVARVLQDHKDEPKIQARIWAAYLTSGVLAGMVFVFILFSKFGPSYLLIGLAGLAGFQSIQFLTWLALLVQSVGNRLGGRSEEE